MSMSQSRILKAGESPMEKLKIMCAVLTAGKGSIGSRLSRVTATVNVPVAEERDRSFKVVPRLCSRPARQFGRSCLRHLNRNARSQGDRRKPCSSKYFSRAAETASLSIGPSPLPHWGLDARQVSEE